MTEGPELTLPVLEGRHARLRAFSQVDVPMVVEASADRFIPLITTVPATPDPALAEAFIRRQHTRADTGAGYERDGLLRSWENVGDRRRDMYMFSHVTQITAT